MKRRTLLLSPLPFVLSSLVNAKPIEKTETAEIVIIGAGRPDCLQPWQQRKTAPEEWF